MSFHSHHYIKNGLKYFSSGYSTSSWSSFLANIVFEISGNDFHDKANTYNNFSTETYLSSKSEKNETKIDRWNDQIIGLLKICGKKT